MYLRNIPVRQCFLDGVRVVVKRAKNARGCGGNFVMGAKFCGEA